MRGRLRGPMAVAQGFGRKRRATRCGGGSHLATPSEFEAQRALADDMLDWYSVYPALLRRLDSGTTPVVIQNFCGGGGATEGCRRAGAACYGVDLYDQPDYRRRYGDDTFTEADGMSWSTIKGLRDKKKADFMMGGPPCKFYSKARVRGEATQPPLIAGFRDQCEALFGDGRKWAIENVMGAGPYMAERSQTIDGSLFGLRVARARLYETNFDLHIDARVRAPAERLAARCCLGGRRRFKRLDEFGRNIKGACCEGNIYTLQGKSPWRCTLAESAAAMGVDIGHMSYERLAQSVPPKYSQLVFSQMCMHQAADKFGTPKITYDEMCARPAWARRVLGFWLRGAGAPEATAGQLFMPAPSLASETPRTARAELHQDDGCEREAEFRELYYSHAGGYDQQLVKAGLGSRLARVANGRSLADINDSREASRAFTGHNTYVEVDDYHTLAGWAVEAVREGGAGTRATFVVRLEDAPALRKLGYAMLPCCVGGKGPDALAYKGLVAMHVGRRAGVTRTFRLEHDAVRPYMDWRDRGGHETDPVRKADLTWQAFPHDPERYKGMGLPGWVERMMTEGVVIKAEAPVMPKDHQQYKWPDGTALVEAVLECDRHLAIGALEYVPDSEVAEALATNVVHPILLVAQGKGKFRACHDYSRGTNHWARSAPFTLPSVWDARAAIKPTSYMCKYDLRDGFFSIPIHPASRNRLMVRHPATGRLCRCARLPFGYVDSPRLFCGLTESIADIVRRRTVGRGVHVFVFVDDFLIVGDDRESARMGGQVLEEVLHELGIPWAPHKQRGPAQCMEFLGLLLSNVPGARMVGLTEKRQAKLRDQINAWREREARPNEAVDVRELASFLGHLVFCSQVVPQGRTYMQAMLAQFSGLEVDWRRGEVRPTASRSAWAEGVRLTEGFWRDLAWWDERFEKRNATPIEAPTRGEVALCGTDASDWGTGQLLWDNGQRAEAVLRFTLAERARPINWRELLGIVRVLEQFGEELRGRSVLIEGDNTASLAAANNETSKAEDSQELVRRLVETCERWDIAVRFTHTPGAKLDRPDQTSRGDPVEEPRVRVRQREYMALAKRHGPFTEWVGAERRHAQTKGRVGATRLWLHPTHSTVGSALRMLGERLADHDGAAASGLVIVPHDENAKWWPLTRHFQVVGRWPSGSAHLEANRMGRWVETCSTRASLILAFPRVVGEQVHKLVWAGGSKEGYEACEDCGGVLMRPMAAGAFVYAPADREGHAGYLMQVWSDFDPATPGQVEFDGDEPTVRGAELLLVGSRGERGRQPYELDRRGDGQGSFAGANCMPWAVHATLLFDVSCLVRYERQPALGKSKGGRLLWREAKELRVTFDWQEAEKRISSSMEEIARSSTSVAVGLAAALQAGGEGQSATDFLARARSSADEAAAMKKVLRPPAREPAQSGSIGVDRSGAETDRPLRCVSAAMTCEGCKGLIGWGKPMQPGGRGMVHMDAECRRLADESLAKGGPEVSGAGPSAGGSEKRHAQASHRFGAERVEAVLACLRGECRERRKGSPEVRLMCRRGCGRGVHGVACCNFSDGVIKLGNLVCAHCRAGDLLAESCTPPEHLVRRQVESMIAEATTGAANTHKGYSDLAALERKWQEDMSEGKMNPALIKLPHTSAEGTYSFALWLAREGGRARSLGTTMRQLAAFCAKLELPNHAASKRVKALLKELEAKGEAFTTPDTQVTTLMIQEMYGPTGTIAEACSKRPEMAALMTARETVLNDFELVGGHRVSEVCGGGDGHGMLANKVCIQRVEEGAGQEYGETIEARIEDSKTTYPRWTVFAARTEKSGIETAQHLRDWWAMCGTHVVRRKVGAFVEERPDYWVVRVSLLDMDRATTFRRFIREIEDSSSLVIVSSQKATLKYARERMMSKTLGDDMKYVNVAGGAREGKDIAEASAWLRGKGFGAYVDIVPGPLIRATSGHKLTHMPYSPTSTHVHLVPAMTKAFDKIQEEGRADPEYDAVTDPVPKFGNHSNRRHGDRVAMRNAAATGVTNEDIDFFFGWNLKKMAETMRLHYAGLDRVLRLRLSNVTRMM